MSAIPIEKIAPVLKAPPPAFSDIAKASNDVRPPAGPGLMPDDVNC
jgi:hypothetical protein